VIPNEHLSTQHGLLVVDGTIKSSKIKKRSVRDPRVRWWNLTRENTDKLSGKIIVEGDWRPIKDAYIMWEAMVKSFTAREVLGIFREVPVD